MIKSKRGVFFLANDRVLELAVPFLNSFRFWNPNLPLCLIPFSSDCGRLKSLQGTYNFTVFDQNEVLEECDRISERFYAKTVGEFRKMCAWCGPFESFVYIDVDTVLLSNLEFVFELLGHYDFLNSHSNYASSRHFTWRDSIFQTGTLTTEQINYSANMGFFASHATAFPREAIANAAIAAEAVKEHMETLCTDQPFMNFLVVTSNLRYTSLSVLRDAGQTAIPDECWAGDGNWLIFPNGEAYYSGVAKKSFMVHWAGQWQPPRVKDGTSNDRKPAPGGNIRQDMRFKGLWEFYSNMQSPGPFRSNEVLELSSAS